jgi:hypothetical protein
MILHTMRLLARKEIVTSKNFLIYFATKEVNYSIEFNNIKTDRVQHYFTFPTFQQVY